MSNTINEIKKIYPCQLKYKELGYFKDYYKNVTKNKTFHCEVCMCDIDHSHKARHLKTQKHQTNEFYKKVSKEIANLNVHV